MIKRAELLVVGSCNKNFNFILNFIIISIFSLYLFPQILTHNPQPTTQGPTQSPVGSKKSTI